MSKKLALLIGVSEYGEGFKPLSASPKDVAALQRVLENPELGSFDQVKALINPNMTEMQQSILELFKFSNKEDLVVLFFSGHGVTNDNHHLYFCTRQTAVTDYLATAVPARFIQNLSDNGNYAKHQVIILDCCYSGAFAEGWQRKGDVKLELERELGKEGRVVLTSSLSTQESWADGNLSLYTQYLVEGIETGAADSDQDGVVKVRELHDYAKRKVREVKPKMQPDIIVADGEGYDIVLSRVKRDAASQFRQLVEKYADHNRGEIRNQRCQEILDQRARELQLTSEETAAIIASVLEPSRRRLKSLERYRQEYEEEAQQKYPLDEATLEELREWQQAVLGLEDQDVELVQQEINARYQGSSLPGHSPSPEPAPQSELEPASWLQTFSFEVVGVDAKGKGVQRESRQAQYFAEELGNGIALEMVQIPGGTFWMGQTEAEKQELIRQVGEEKYQQWYARELPRHQVKISPFFMGKFPVTQAQYEAVMRKNPATQYDRDRFVAPDKPVIDVSWHDAVAFCDRLSQQTGQTYRLPSEAEWEYACRAGTETPFHFGETITTDLANYDGNYTYGDAPKGAYRKQTTTVGRFPANAFGLFDMHGNVWEWCLDHLHNNYQGAPTDGSAWNVGGNSDRRILRGGSWYSFPRNCRSACRDNYGPGYDSDFFGFRVVCGVPRT